MAAKTYFSLFSTGVQVFPGHTTNIGSQCVSVSGPGLLGELSTVNSLCAGSSPRFQATGTTTNHMSFAIGGFISSKVVTGTNCQIFIRKPSVKNFWLESYNSTGALQQTSVVATVTGSSVMAQVNLAACKVTVPSGGFLRFRTGFTGGSNRLYFGTNPKATGLPSMVLTVDEALAVTGPTGTGSGIIGSFAGSATGTANSIVAIRITVRDEAGNPISGARVFLKAASGGSLAVGTEIMNMATNGSGVAEITTFNYTSDQPIIGWARQGTVAPYFQTGIIGNLITIDGFKYNAYLKND